MTTQTKSGATDRVLHQLHRAVETTRVDLDRVEFLSDALTALSQPVPDYEPRFRHLHQPALNTFKMPASAGRK